MWWSSKIKSFDIKKFLKETAANFQVTAKQNTADAWERLRSERVNYFPPSESPFKCGNCEYFNAETGYCRQEEVRANVEAEGCCNLFEKK